MEEYAINKYCFKGTLDEIEESIRKARMKEALKLPPFQEVIRNSLIGRTGIVDWGDLSKSNLTNEEERESELFDETRKNALKAINYMFKSVFCGNKYDLTGADINNLVHGLNKL